VAVGGNWRIEEGEVNHRSRRKDRKAERRSRWSRIRVFGSG